MSRVLKRLLVLAGVAAAMLVLAVPAFAQPQAPLQSNIGITGVIQQVAPAPEGPSFFITEDGTGEEYALFSDARGADLSQYAGQRVTVNGVIQAVDAPVYVISVEIPEDSPVGEPVSVTGVLEPRGLAADRTDITHFLTDEASGETWGMISGDPAASLDPYNGQRVTVTGTNATKISFAGDETLAVNVENVEPLDKGDKPSQPPAAPGNENPGQYDDPGQYDNDGNTGNQYDDGADKTIPPADDGSPDGSLSDSGSPEGDSPDGVLSVLPDTGGLSPVTLGATLLLLLSGGLLTYAAIRQR